MKNILKISLLGILILVSWVLYDKSEDTLVLEHSKVSYPIVWVHDGDTFNVKKNGEIVTVRVLGINTPEVESKYKKEECFGPEASERAKEILIGEKVFLEGDESQKSHDIYGRLLAYVFLENGDFFNKQMIEEGYGYEYAFKGKDYKYKKEFQEAEQKAKEEGLGLWGECR